METLLRMLIRGLPAVLLLILPLTLSGQGLKSKIEPAIRNVESKVIDWRRDIHEHPELSNRETRTAGIVAQHLRDLGLEVKEGIAKTGVVGILEGGQEGPVVALRADMDALPVKEQTDLPFASTKTTTYKGEEVGVMHACGHDAHTSMLMGVAEVLAGIRNELPGTIKFIFQPAEEGAPPGEEGGASLMIKEGVLDPPYAPEAIFALHVFPQAPGSLHYLAGGAMAAADRLQIKVKGSQTHGAKPWGGVDPVVVASQVVTGLQTVISRQSDLTKAPAVLSIGSIHGGNRWNIIPEGVEMEGTIRTFDMDMRGDIIERVRQTANNIAAASGATAEVEIQNYAPVVYNDPDLTRKMIPSLKWAGGEDRVGEFHRITGAEDFAFYQQEVKGFYFYLGINKEGVSPEEAAPNHSPHFYVNEDALIVGVKALAGVAVDYLEMNR